MAAIHCNGIKVLICQKEGCTRNCSWKTVEGHWQIWQLKPDHVILVQGLLVQHGAHEYLLLTFSNAKKLQMLAPRHQARYNDRSPYFMKRSEPSVITWVGTCCIVPCYIQNCDKSCKAVVECFKPEWASTVCHVNVNTVKRWRFHHG